MKKTIILTATVVAFLVACNTEQVNRVISSAPILGDYSYPFPGEIPDEAFSMQSWRLEVTDAKAELGRVLFYDRNMSVNNKVSCGTCHQQELGFADGLKTSKGFIETNTERHSMALANPMGQSSYFWDTRAWDIVDQVMMPVSNHIEMGINDLDLLVAKLQALDYYPGLFERAYGSDTIDRERIAEALASFVGSMVSYNTKFDKVNREEAIFTAQEAMGQKLFMEKFQCSQCHGGFTFNQHWGFFDSRADIGLDAADPNDPYKTMMKVPTLRNVALTAPYMHDGRFASLEDVINHYDHGINKESNIDWRLSSLLDDDFKMNMTAEEKQAIIAFLHTLTDEVLTTHPKFSDPFN